MKYNKPYHNEVFKRTRELLKPLLLEAVKNGVGEHYTRHIMSDAVDNLYLTPEDMK